MGKKKEENPTINLADAIRELELINGKVFQLKMGARNLIDAVNRGNVEMMKHVIEVFKMEEILNSLSIEL